MVIFSRRRKGKKTKPYPIRDKNWWKRLPPPKRGSLGVRFVDGMSEEQIKRQLRAEVARDGEAVVRGRLAHLASWNKNKNPKLAEEARKWQTWVAGSFEGKRYVGYPQGFA